MLLKTTTNNNQLPIIKSFHFLPVNTRLEEAFSNTTQSENTRGMMTSPKKGACSYPQETVKYFLSFSLKTIIISQL